MVTCLKKAVGSHKSISLAELFLRLPLLASICPQIGDIARASKGSCSVNAMGGLGFCTHGISLQYEIIDELGAQIELWTSPFVALLVEQVKQYCRGICLQVKLNFQEASRQVTHLVILVILVILGRLIHLTFLFKCILPKYILLFHIQSFMNILGFFSTINFEAF